jgi:ectoine hydroxylase-related dioxygenase (phytanoyl-CoA dioxygenase family)
MTTQVLATGTDAARVRDYHQTGYMIVREAFGAEEIAALAGEADTLLARTDLINASNIRCRWADHVETGECLFDCFDPVTDIGPVSRYIARHEAILAPLRGIYGDEPCLLKDKLIFKRPGAKGYALHQDYISWKEFPESFITVIVAIDATDAQNGATEVFGGYHRQGYLSARDGDYHELALEAVDPAAGVILDLRPGDLGIFSGFTPHRSEANKSQGSRRQLYLSYNAAGDGGQQRDAHYRQFHAWLAEKYAQYGRTGVYFR